MYKIDEIIRSKRRTLTIEVTLDEKIIVKAPLRVSLNEIDLFVSRNEDWISKTIKNIKEKYNHYSPLVFNENVSLLFLGKDYPIKFVKSGKIVINDYFELPINFKTKSLRTWYIKHARELISSRVFLFAKQLCLSYKKIKITSGIRTVGSCTSQGYLNFSWLLILLPEEIIDYIVVHELVHINIKNHSRKFWNEVAVTDPQYLTHRKQLKKYLPDFYRYKKAI